MIFSNMLQRFSTRKLLHLISGIYKLNKYRTVYFECNTYCNTAVMVPMVMHSNHMEMKIDTRCSPEISLPGNLSGWAFFFFFLSL